MVKRVRKEMALLIVLCMVFLLAACGGAGQNGGQSTSGAPASSVQSSSSAATEKETEKEPVTVTWLGAVWSQNITTGIVHNPVFDEITKRTGVTIDHTPTLGVADVGQKLAILLAGQDLPDVVTLTDQLQLPKVFAAKAAIPLDDLVKSNGPDLLANAASMLKLSKITTSDDTNALYTIRGQAGDDGEGDLYGWDNDWVVRWDLYKKLGMPKINNYDDLLNLGEAMMELEPTNKEGKKNYAFGNFLGDTWGYLFLTKPADNYSGIKCYHMEAAINVQNDQVVPYITDPGNEFWAQTQAMNRAYQRGLYDPESATLKFQDYLAKARTGRYFMGVSEGLMGGAAAVFREDGETEKGFVPIIFGEIKPQSFFTEAAADGNQYSTFITKNCKNPDRVIDLLNFLSTPEGIMLTYYGIEGTDWEIEPDGGYMKVTEETAEKINNDADYHKKMGIRQLYNIMPVSFRGIKDPRGFALYPNPAAFLTATTTAPYLKDFCETMNVQYPAQVLMKSDHYSYWNTLFSNITLPAGSDVTEKSNQIGAYLPTAVAKAVFAKTDEDFDRQKANIIKTCADMGAPDVLDYYAKQYDAAKQKLAEIEKTF